MKPLRQWGARFAGALLLFYVLPAFAIGAVRALRRTRDAEVLAFCKGGFGYTAVFPDFLRRAFRGRRVAAIFLSEVGRYNPLVGEIFPDCAVEIVEVRCSVTVFGVRFVAPSNWWLGQVFYPALRWWCIKVRRRQGYLLPEEWLELLPAPELAVMGEGHLSLDAELHAANAYPRYYLLRQNVPMLPARLPETAAQPIMRALERIGPARKSCCLYLRHKWASKPENDNRNGGDLADYLPAVEWLIAQGYRVLLTGDYELAPDIVGRFAGMFVDHRAAGVDWQRFSLYAATRSDIWIGVDGGAAVLPLVADLPMLGINWFPYFALFPGMVLHYKYLLRPDGSLVPPGELFDRFAFDWRCEGYALCDNTPEQIRAAVVDFVQRIESGQDMPGLSPRELGRTAPDVWFNLAPAWISTPWLEPFRAMVAQVK